MKNLRAAASIGIAWGIIWAAVWTLVGIVIGIVDPESIDPGESPYIIGLLTGFMGLLSGIAFWFLLTRFECDRSIAEMSMSRVALWAVLGSAFVQLFFLGHGDVGVLENLKQAAMFAAFGGIAGVIWLLLARRWPIWRAFL